MTQIKDNYYITTLKHVPSYPVLAGTVETDVCVIGGGLAGINTALGLLERGKSAVVLEAKRIGYGASGRNAGFVAKGYAAGEPALAKKLGLEKARDLVALTKGARKLIQKRVKEFNIECGPVTPGVLTISWKDKPQDLKDYIGKANDDFDLGFEFWPRERVREHCKTDKYYDGIFSPHDFQMNPLQYLMGITAQVVLKGGRVFEDSGVLAVKKDGSGWRVETSGGVVRAEHVVLSVAAYSSGLDRRLENSVVPVQTYITVTKPLPDDVYRTSINSSHAIYDTRFCSDYYRRLPDNRLLWGGRVGLFAHPSNIAEAMVSDMLRIYPQLEGIVEPEFAWSGLLAYPAHKMPQIGMFEKGYWYNTGYGGHGLCPTTAGGEVVAAAIADGDQAYHRFDPFGVHFTGGRLSRFGAQGVYLWWKLRDVLGI